MANIRNLKENNGDVFYPLTHERAVRDSNGVTLDSKLAGLESKSYIEAWNGTSTPVVANIPAGITVTYNTTTYTGTLAASASTIGKIYLVKNGSNYDQYITSKSGSTYSWVFLGSTTLQLSGYATEAELDAVSKKVANVILVSQETSEEAIEFQTDGGNFIAKVSPSGIEATDVLARVGSSSVSLAGLYKDSSNTVADSLSLGDANGKNIVEFTDGHVRTKFFDSASVLNRIEDLEEGGGGGGGSTATIDDKTQRQLDLKEDYYSYKYGKLGSGSQANWFERLRILHFSDNHDNLTNLAEMKELKDLVHLIVDTGDNSNNGRNGSGSDTMYFLNRYVNAIGDTALPLLVTQGNHDSYGTDLTKQQYYQSVSAMMASKCPGFVFGDPTHYRSYGYLDIKPNDTIGWVRIILLDAFDYADGLYLNPYGLNANDSHTHYRTPIPSFGDQFAEMNCVFSQTQINWFINTLKDALSVQDNHNYKIITAMHYAFGDYATYSEDYVRTDAYFHQDPFMIPDIIDAFQNKTPLSATYNDDENINNITVNITSSDFTGLNDLHYICHLFGHIHSENEYQCRKSTTGNKAYDMLMLGAPSMGQNGVALNKAPRQDGTLNSIKLTILEIDTVSHDVYRVNYGAYKDFDMVNTARTKKIHYRFSDNQ